MQQNATHRSHRRTGGRRRPPVEGRIACPRSRRSSASASSEFFGDAPGPVLDHRLVGVADRDDPRAERYLVAGEPVRVAAAVPALVAGANQLCDRDEGRRRRQYPLPDQGVVPHHFPFAVVERAWLFEDLRPEPPSCRRHAAEPLGRRRRAARRRAPGSDRARTASSATPSRCVPSSGSRSCSVRIRTRDGLALGRAGTGPLLGVHAAVGEPQGLAGASASCGKQDGAAASFRPRTPLRPPGGQAWPLRRSLRVTLSSSRASTQNSSPPSRYATTVGLHRSRQLVSQASEQHVAGEVTEAVVVGLEPVEVEDREQCRCALSSAAVTRSRSWSSRRRFPSPVSGSVSASDCDWRSRITFSSKARIIRTTTITSVAPESQIARSETRSKWSYISTATPTEREQRRKHEHAPWGRRRPALPPRGVQAAAGDGDRPDEPESVRPRPRRVAHGRLLLQVDAVGDRDHRKSARRAAPSSGPDATRSGRPRATTNASSSRSPSG